MRKILLKKKEKEIRREEEYYVASQWQLMWRKSKKHKLAILGGAVLVIFYMVAILGEFFSPYDIKERHSNYVYCPPQRIRFFDEEGFHLRPFVYGFERAIDPETFHRIYTVDKAKKYPIYFFTRGTKYKLWGLFSGDVHLFGVKEGTIFLFGTEKLGRDLFSRNIYASRISLSISLVGVALSFVPTYLLIYRFLIHFSVEKGTS